MAISYPTDRILQTAAKIRTNAHNAIDQHNRHWQQVQDCISPLPGFMQSLLRFVLEPHDKRLRESFQWQLDYADRLEVAAGRLVTLEGQITHSF
ncbi:MAG: hypothetical protein JO202_16290 [Ktedonobacteraceae bacterium]|nr:hypothetical protein [Ktedonobacteraceae bacterium]